METNVFALLTSGVRFNKKKLEKDLGKFSQSRNAGQDPQPPVTPSESAVKKLRKRKAGSAAGPLDINVFQAQRQAEAAEYDASADEAEEAGARQGRSHDPMEEANVLRKRLRIHVKGDVAPAPLASFEEMGTRYKCGKRLLENLQEAGWAAPTSIQAQAIPALLEDRDVLAMAPTGSGKTLAFLIPTIVKLRRLRHTLGEGAWPAGPKAVVLSPTHELAGQQGRVLARILPGSGLRASVLSRATAIGSDFSKVDVLVANPLRLASMVDEKKVDLSQVRIVVLDEADKLFQMGFLEQLDRVLAACSHPDTLRALFSATLPEKVEALARSVMPAPLRITVGERNAAAATVKQRLLFVGRESGKLVGLRQLLVEGIKPPVLVFTNSKERAAELHRELMYDGVHVDSIHADQPQVARSAAVENFRIGRTWVLIATDLIGRGMDFIGVNTVINYDFPNSTLDYIHRIGRTGRAGHMGEAVTFFTEEDSGKLRAIANVMRGAGCDVPEWMLHLKKAERNRHKDRPRDVLGRGEGGADTSPRPGHAGDRNRPGSNQNGLAPRKAVMKKSGLAGNSKKGKSKHGVVGEGRAHERRSQGGRANGKGLLGKKRSKQLADSSPIDIRRNIAKKRAKAHPED